MTDDARKARRLQIRGDERSHRLGTWVGGLMRGWAATWRVDARDEAGVFAPGAFGGPVIFALWHDCIFTVPPVWRTWIGHHRHAVVLTSASKDGAVLEAALAGFGIGAVRGSSSRRAVAGLIGLRQAMRAGSDTCITPDGPKGPRHVCQPGVIKLAQTTGSPIIPIRCGFSSMRRLNTWDRFILPLPFSAVRVCFGKPMLVPADADEEGFEGARKALEDELCRPLGDTD
ncbi:MAG: lysophospholipid acyltransferase family protein [Luteolibacter sp.]